MKKPTFKNGSALLVVLGMVSFMVISAVGFAVYMRQNRAPSSFLRRNTAARQLAKTALARAIANIEYYMGEASPYPGVGGVSSENRWYGHVLCPEKSGTFSTVSTLTLEALAYLPPAYVNDVRYYSRKTPTAQWKSLPYAAGRYAYTAVDVSDCFDLSRVQVTMPRGSSESNLVTLAYLFEDGNHTSYWQEPSEFQDFLDKVAESTEGSFVSIADYNLALKNYGAGKMTSPFCDYLTGSGASGFYGFTSLPGETSPEYLKYAAQRFVTDGRSDLKREEWFDEDDGSASENDSKYIDITDQKKQPFPRLLTSSDSETKNDMSAAEIIDSTEGLLNDRVKEINPAESVALYDYLDRDNVPASVALPTVERTPMIVGIELENEGALTMTIMSDGENNVSDEKDEASGIYYQRKTVTFYPQFSGEFAVNVGFTFPFLHQQERNQSLGNFTAQATGGLYFDTVKDTTDGCRSPIGGIFSSWVDSNSGGTALKENALVQFASQTMATGVPTGTIENETDAVSTSGGQLKDVRLSISGFESIDFKEVYLARYWLVREGKENPQSGMVEYGEWYLDPNQNGGKASFEGLHSVSFKNGKAEKFVSGSTYYPQIALAVKLTDKNSNLVDMAPAHVNDDTQAPSGDLKSWLGSLGRPALRFSISDETAGIALDETLTGYESLADKVEKATATEMQFTPGTYLTDDPRYNYAAENWYPETGDASGALGADWLQKVQAANYADNANDIFMSVSNQGYLQDAGEFAFLPMVCGFNNPTEMQPVVNAQNGTIPADIGSLANHALMWRTYNVWGNDDNNVDNLKLTQPPTGFHINPYSSDDIIKLAPFMNTPYDWWAAGTNLSDEVKSKMIDEDGYSPNMETTLKYTIGPRGTEMQVDKDKIKELADAISSAIRSNTEGNWYDAYRTLDWNGGSDTEICGVDLGIKLHDVDRKYLYSYWRKCYANQQNLFLIFFRAEPVVLGGGVGEGQTPAQLGAKGVALVWRDPKKPENASSDKAEDDTPPHKTRILFYHQFD